MAQFGLTIRVECSRFFDNTTIRTNIEHFSCARDSFIEEHIDLDFTKGRCYLIFHYFYFYTISECFFIISCTGFKLFFFTDFKTLRCIEFECISSCGRFRITKHNTDLHTDLIDEYDSSIWFSDHTRHLSKGLTHETSLKPHETISHISFDFCFWGECCDRIYNDEVDCSRSYQCIYDLEGLLTIVRLGYDKIVYIDTDISSIGRIECVFSIHECCCSSGFLDFSDSMESKCRLSWWFWSINFDDASFGIATTECFIECERSRRVHLDIHMFTFTELHHWSSTELFFDHGESSIESIFFIISHRGRD